jgi:hypothetical protein
MLFIDYPDNPTLCPGSSGLTQPALSHQDDWLGFSHMQGNGQTRKTRTNNENG